MRQALRSRPDGSSIGPAPHQGPRTLTEAALDKLVADIVSGALPPETKLGIEQLKSRYAIGASPLREALARLIALGFATNESRRGFRVAAMSREDLEDITFTRRTVEAAALRRAIERGDEAWEAGIVESLARLQWEAGRFRRGVGTIEDVDAAHFGFHRSLLASCGSPRLLALQETLFHQASRYRYVMMKILMEESDFPRSHDALAEVVLSRNAEQSCDRIRLHLETLPKVCYR